MGYRYMVVSAPYKINDWKQETIDKFKFINFFPKDDVGCSKGFCSKFEVKFNELMDDFNKDLQDNYEIEVYSDFQYFIIGEGTSENHIDIRRVTITKNDIKIQYIGDSNYEDVDDGIYQNW